MNQLSYGKYPDRNIRECTSLGIEPMTFCKQDIQLNRSE